VNRGPSDLRNEFYALPPVARFERITVQRARKPFSACAARSQLMLEDPHHLVQRLATRCRRVDALLVQV
jgi:hypothetical protein